MIGRGAALNVPPHELLFRALVQQRRLLLIAMNWMEGAAEGAL